MDNQKTPVRHIVIFKYREGTASEQIEQVTRAFRSLKHQIPGILSFEQGINNSPEGKNFAFTHVYALTFASCDARDDYLPHPRHLEFGALLERLGIVEDIFVIDYLPSP